jgi:hypothetical protein
MTRSATKDGGRLESPDLCAPQEDSEGHAASIFDELREGFHESDNEPWIFRVCWKHIGLLFFIFLPIQNRIDTLLELL